MGQGWEYSKNCSASHSILGAQLWIVRISYEDQSADERSEGLPRATCSLSRKETGVFLAPG
jgi:hypothetical protein